MESHNTPPEHYYGDIVRKLFLLAGILLLVAIPLDTELYASYLTLGIVAALTLILLAGFTSPRNRKTTVGDMVVAALGFVIFEYFAVNHYVVHQNFFEMVFMLRQALALVFIIAVYFCSKTFRGSINFNL